MTAVGSEVLTADAMVERAREQVAAFNGGDWQGLRAGLASDSRYEEFGTERKVEGPEQIVELFKGWKQAFPNAAGTVTSAVASGDKAALEVTWTGTHTGPLVTAEGTIPASGQASADARCHLLHLRRRQDQGEPPVLRLADAPQAARRAAQVAAGAKINEGATRPGAPSAQHEGARTAGRGRRCARSQTRHVSQPRVRKRNDLTTCFLGAPKRPSQHLSASWRAASAGEIGIVVSSLFLLGQIPFLFQRGAAHSRNGCAPCRVRPRRRR